MEEYLNKDTRRRRIFAGICANKTGTTFLLCRSGLVLPG